MRSITVAQLKALLSAYDDDVRIKFFFKTPVKEVAYKEYSGGDYVNLNLSEIEKADDNSIIKIVLTRE